MTTPRVPPPPAPPRPKSAWRHLVSASAQTLASANPIALSESLSERLDRKMAHAIRHQDSPRFEAALLQAHRHCLASKSALLAPQSLSESIWRGDASFLERLLAYGANPNARAVPIADANLPAAERSLIHLAAETGRSFMLETLLRYGADLLACSSHGSTPLMLAADKGCLASARLLISRGAPLNERDHLGRSALARALPYDPANDTLVCPNAPETVSHRLFDQLILGAEVASALLKAGASAAAPPASLGPLLSGSLPPLAGAIRIRDHDLIERLIRAGADASWLLNPRSESRPSFEFSRPSIDPAHWARQIAARPDLASARDHAIALARPPRPPQPRNAPSEQSPALAPPSSERPPNLASRRAADALRSSPLAPPADDPLSELATQRENAWIAKKKSLKL